MAVISLDSQTIQTLGSEIAALDSALINGYFPELESELAAISANVQGDELHGIINTINSQFSSVKAELSVALPKLESFLDEQMKTYQVTEEELDTELNSVVAKMNNISGNTTPGSEGGSNPSGNEQSSSDMDAVNQRLEALEKQNTELQDRSNDSIVTDVAEGAVVGAGAGAAIGAVVGTIVPGAGTLAGAAIGAKVGAWVGGSAPVIADVAEGAWDGICTVGKGAANIGGALWEGAKTTWGNLWD